MEHAGWVLSCESVGCWLCNRSRQPARATTKVLATETPNQALIYHDGKYYLALTIITAWSHSDNYLISSAASAESDCVCFVIRSNLAPNLFHQSHGSCVCLITRFSAHSFSIPPWVAQISCSSDLSCSRTISLVPELLLPASNNRNRHSNSPRITHIRRRR